MIEQRPADVSPVILVAFDYEGRNDCKEYGLRDHGEWWVAFGWADLVGTHGKTREEALRKFRERHPEATNWEVDG